MQSSRLKNARIRQLKTTDGVIRLESFGDWIINALRDAAEILEQFSRASRNVSIHWDVSDILRVDSAALVQLNRPPKLLKL